MHILCPHCHNPIELVRLTPREDITCPSCGSSFCLDTGSTSAGTLCSGQLLGRFTLLDTIGQGAFGTVYRARDPELDRTVAMKVPRAGNLAAPQELDRFLREARSVAQLRHPGIVVVHEVGQADGLPYLVSDFVEGVTLSDLLSARRLGQRESAELLAKVAEAVQYAHGQGVVHRDLKPSNIMLDGAGKPVVMDFGLAKREAGEITMTVDGQILGTPAYMSPEQARGESHKVDGRSDVYSLGVILYELLTGELPFRGTKRMLLHQVLHDEPRSPRRLNDTIARDLETICLKAMAKEPGKRYGTARELAEDLSCWLRGEPITARPVGRLEKGWRWCKRNPAVASLLATVFLVLTAGVTVSSVLALLASEARQDAQREAEEATAARKEVERKAEELRQSRDRLEQSRAGSLLRPLGLKGRGPLADPEIEALWELAGAPEEELRLRFVEEAMGRPGTARQLTDRAEFALHAAVGLDVRRQERVEKLLRQRMASAELDLRLRADLAMAVSRTGALDRLVARDAANLLAQAMSKTTASRALSSLGQGLSAVVVRLEPRDAKESANLLAQAMSKTTEPSALWPLAQVLPAVAARLEPRDAANLLARAMSTSDAHALQPLAQGLSAVAPRLKSREAKETANLLAQAMSKTTNPYALWPLAQGLSAVAARLEAEDAKEAVNLLAQAMSKTVNPHTLWPLAQGLSAVAARLEPREAATLCGQAANRLAQAMRTTTESDALEFLALGLSALAARLEPREAANLLSGVIMSTTTESVALVHLGQGLSAVAARLALKDAKEAANLLARGMSKTTNAPALQQLAQGLSVVAPRLEPKDAKEAANLLVQTMSKTTDLNALLYLGQGLSAVAARLEPEDAKEVAHLLAQAMSKPAHPSALWPLAQVLPAVAARLEPRDAAIVCGQAAKRLALAMSTMTDFGTLPDLVRGLSAVAPCLEAKDAKEAANLLAQAMSMTTDPNALWGLARGLSAVAPRLEPREAANLLVQAMSKTADYNTSLTLGQGLSTVAARLEPREAKEAANRLAQAMSTTTDVNALFYLAQGLSAVAARLDSREAAPVCGQARNRLGHVMSTTTDPFALFNLARGLSAVAARLEARDAKEAANFLTRAMSKTTDPHALSYLAQELSVVAARLEPRDAATLCGQAANWLSQAMTKSSDLDDLARGLLAVAPLLEPRDAKEVANRLAKEVANRPAQAMGPPDRPNELSQFAQGLSAVAARLEPREAATVCREVANRLAQAMRVTTDDLAWSIEDPDEMPDGSALWPLAQGLSALAARLEPREAANLLAQAMSGPASKTLNVGAVRHLRPGLSAVAARLKPRDAKAAANLFAQAMSKTTDARAHEAHEYLAQGLSAFLTGTPFHQRQVPAVLFSVGLAPQGPAALAALPLLQSSVRPLPCRLSTPELVELLKHPLCVGKARRVVLDQLEDRYDRKFADQWEFVRFATEQRLGLDFTTPPQRPEPAR